MSEQKQETEITIKEATPQKSEREESVDRSKSPFVQYEKSEGSASEESDKEFNTRSSNVVKYAQIKEILQVEPKERIRPNLRTLEDFFKDNQFFVQEKKRTNDSSLMDNLLRNMKLEEFQRGEMVFRFGDQGETFYIIISGEVQIRTPSPVELERNQATPEGLLSFLVSYYDDIYWEKIQNGVRIKEEFEKELGRFDLHPSKYKNNKIELLKLLDRRILKGDTKIHKFLFKLANPHGRKNITLVWFKSVAKLSNGASFGERALIKNEERAATIICSQNCSFATLHRKDYNWIIGSSMKRQLKNTVEFFRNFRIFSNLRTNVIEKIHYYMKPKEFFRGQKIYTQGQNTIDGVYFIQSGEFEVYQMEKSGGGSHSSKRASDDEAGDKNIRNLIRSKSNNLLRQVGRKSKINQERNGGQDKQSGLGNLYEKYQNSYKASHQKKISLYLVGKNEIFGLEEIIENGTHRKLSVQCTSTTASVFFITQENFIDCVNQFRFSEKVLQEQIIKHKHYMERIQQTKVFQDVFNKEQQKQLYWNQTFKKFDDQLSTERLAGGARNESVDSSPGRNQKDSDSPVVRQFKETMRSFSLEKRNQQSMLNQSNSNYYLNKHRQSGIGLQDTQNIDLAEQSLMRIEQTLGNNRSSLMKTSSVKAISLVQNESPFKRNKQNVGSPSKQNVFHPVTTQDSKQLARSATNPRLVRPSATTSSVVDKNNHTPILLGVIPQDSSRTSAALKPQSIHNADLVNTSDKYNSIERKNKALDSVNSADTKIHRVQPIQVKLKHMSLVHADSSSNFMGSSGAINTPMKAMPISGNQTLTVSRLASRDQKSRFSGMQASQKSKAFMPTISNQYGNLQVNTASAATPNGQVGSKDFIGGGPGARRNKSTDKRKSAVLSLVKLDFAAKSKVHAVIPGPSGALDSQGYTFDKGDEQAQFEETQQRMSRNQSKSKGSKSSFSEFLAPQSSAVNINSITTESLLPARMRRPLVETRKKLRVSYKMLSRASLKTVVETPQTTNNRKSFGFPMQIAAQNVLQVVNGSPSLPMIKPLIDHQMDEQQLQRLGQTKLENPSQIDQEQFIEFQKQLHRQQLIPSLPETAKQKQMANLPQGVIHHSATKQLPRKHRYTNAQDTDLL